MGVENDMSVCVCVWEIYSIWLLFCHISSSLPVWHSIRARPCDIFRQLNSVTFWCHPLLSFLTATAQTLMHSHRARGGWNTASLKVCSAQSCFFMAPSNRLLRAQNSTQCGDEIIQLFFLHSRKSQTKLLLLIFPFNKADANMWNKCNTYIPYKASFPVWTSILLNQESTGLKK